MGIGPLLRAVVCWVPSVLRRILECHMNLQECFSKVVSVNSIRKWKIMLSTLP